MSKKQVLGRGLSEILGEVSKAYENNMGDPATQERVVEIGLDQIIPNPYQPRKYFDPLALQELADSIREHGLLQPILVYEDGGQYVLIAGERRLRASKLCKNQTIKAIVAEIDLSRLREVALIENIQREDLNPIELAHAYEELLKTYKITHEGLAERIQKSRTQITNTLRLLQLGANVQKLLVEGKITQGHAKALVGLESGKQEKIAHTIIGRKLSVREVENLVKNTKTTNLPKEHKIDLADPEDIQKIEEILKKNQISFQFKKLRNSISISLKNSEEIRRFLGLIAQEIC
ncbi:ParB/RepB/Spo0J family partition protein [Helicobacter pametensis]|uniref:ParB/RepB/Spo0J family partition protein n=1 Tax=Helicobacter pametensis TaxID=95149 RepID=UPI000483AF62|nr:ParB/RepB/Spo0J family partition protein [Helicobacter pametensis]